VKGTDRTRGDQSRELIAGYAGHDVLRVGPAGVLTEVRTRRRRDTYSRKTVYAMWKSLDDHRSDMTAAAPAEGQGEAA
jgi:hypothetical protein